MLTNIGQSLPLSVRKSWWLCRHGRPQIHDLYDALATNDQRNRLIVADIEKAVAEGRCPLVLTERVDHLERLEQLLSACPVPKIILKGGMGKKPRTSAQQQIQAHEGARIILATGRYVGEGFGRLPVKLSKLLREKVQRRLGEVSF